MASLTETPPNLNEPRVKEVKPRFPQDRDLPKFLARMLPPLTVTAPLMVMIINGHPDIVIRFSGSPAATNPLSPDVDTVQLVGFALILLAHILMQ